MLTIRLCPPCCPLASVLKCQATRNQFTAESNFYNRISIALKEKGQETKETLDDILCVDRERETSSFLSTLFPILPQPPPPLGCPWVGWVIQRREERQGEEVYLCVLYMCVWCLCCHSPEVLRPSHFLWASHHRCAGVYNHKLNVAILYEGRYIQYSTLKFHSPGQLFELHFSLV